MYIVVYVDSFSKWSEALSVPNGTSDTIDETLSEFIGRHGCPTLVVTDWGTQLLRKVIAKVYENLDINDTMTL